MLSTLSGFSPSIYLGKNFHKPQHFLYKNGLRFEKDLNDRKPKISRACQLIGNDAYIRNTLPNLTFTAFYREKLGEEDKSTTRFRKCNVAYFLETDDIKIYEPHQKNSGLSQGVIVSKGRYQKPSGEFYSIDDLNIGNSLFIFGKEYKLINCDAFTRNFLSEMGFRVPSPQPDVYDPITEDRNEMNGLHSYRRPREKNYPLASFLRHHPQCLRFYGQYGSGKNQFETKKEVTLYYDLSNGKIKLVEKRGNDSGHTNVLLSATHVPKKAGLVNIIGGMGEPTLLNLAHDIQNVLIGGEYYKMQNPASGLIDSNPANIREKDINYYTDEDLDLGKPINIFSSVVFLYDCDEFTRSYYRTTYNKELIPVPRPEEDIPHTHKLIYRHEDFGQADETMRTNDPFPPKKYTADALKFFKTDKRGYDDRQLTFLARLLTDDPIDKSKTFVLCWFMEDDTLAIRDVDKYFSDASRYVRRMKITKPQSLYENSGSCFYTSLDMYVGNVIYVIRKAFELIEADEYTYDYMERHSDVFHVSNIKLILANIRNTIRQRCKSITSRFEEKDCNGTGYITYEDFKTIILDEIPEELKKQLPEHSIKTIARYYAEDEYTGLLLEDLILQVKTALYRKKFQDFKSVKVAFEVHDEKKTGFLEADRAYFVLRTISLPIDRDLLKSFIYKFPKTDGKINFHNLIEAMNYLTNASHCDKIEPKQVRINWQRSEAEKNLNKIKYRCFIQDCLTS